MSGISRRRANSDGMSVLSLHLTHDRTWQPRSRDLMLLRIVSKPHAATTYDTPFGRNVDKRRLLEQLKAENAELRDRVVELALQIQVLRDAWQR
jgi:hypothetical protein